VSVLLIEQHRILARTLKRGLEEEGFEVAAVHDGEEADFRAATGDYEAIILDPKLPSEDGLALLRRWRDAGLTTPVLVLTARTGVAEEALVRLLGADDYLPMPFAVEDLLARLRALTGRDAEAKVDASPATLPWLRASSANYQTA
jgi:two-component system OmpR family response regulator